MRLSSLLVTVQMLALSVSFAQDFSRYDEASVQQIRMLIASAPTATNKVDRSYGIKIPENVRRKAIAKCKELLAKDKGNDQARGLLGDLLDGEGPYEAVAILQAPAPAAYGNPANILKKLGTSTFAEVLRANLIPFGLAGSRGQSINVYSSHADRARFLLAQLVLKQGLEMILTRTAEDGTRWGEVKPEDAITAYSE